MMPSLHYESSLNSGHDLYALLGLARVRVKTGDLALAMKHCEQALAHDRDHPRVLEEMAKLHEMAGDSAAAASCRARIKAD